MPLGLVAVVEPVWGWSIRVPLASVGGGSLPLPPPSTIVGALLYGLASRRAWGERLEGWVPAWYTRLERYILSASAGLLEGYVVAGHDVLRVTNAPFLKPGNLDNINQWFSVSGFGVTLAPGSRICLALVLDDNVLKLGIGVEDLTLSAWSASRIGSKEGLASIVEAGVFRAEEIDRAKTLLYAGERYAREGLVATMWRYRRDGYEPLRVRLALEKIGPIHAPKPITVSSAWRLRGAPKGCEIVPRVW